ncbi:MAG: phosphodiester glycosidase family protein [Porphyromonas sp.]|nr:phosphodiester glycosidase family protein [Porphyromonas sp.]
MKTHPKQLFLLLLLFLVGCNDPDVLHSNLIMPGDLTISQPLETNKVTLTWSDQNSQIDGFLVSYKPLGAEEYIPIETVSAEVRTYTIEQKLEVGQSYYFAVEAVQGSDYSYPATALLKVINADENKGVSIVGSFVSHAGVAVKYMPVNLFPSENKYHGLEVSLAADKDAEVLLDVPAPEDWRDQKSCLQMIPITRLPKDQAKIYIRAYSKGDQTAYYSPKVEVTMAAQPDAIKLEWNEITPEELKGKVQLFKTTSQLNGRPFNAWYAVGNPETTRIKRNDPMYNTPLAQQAALLGSKALVLVNGSYYYQSITLGIYGHNGLKGTNDLLRGSLKSDHPEYDVRYDAMRGFFGVTKEGDAKVYWGGMDKGTPRLYEHPQPVLIGEAKYAGYAPEIVGAPVEWVPYYGLSGGPIVLKEGNVLVDFEQFKEGDEYYLGNFELIPYDIFGKNVAVDRTAVGVMDDGRIVLFVCDGRIPESKGANLIELAQIMKGIGCVDALNLDGGGSTNMWAAGAIVNHKDIVPGTDDTRAIRSIIGFFDK